jgi:hypothetical protein
VQRSFLHAKIAIVFQWEDLQMSDDTRVEPSRKPRKRSVPKKGGTENKPTAKGTPWTFPKNTLEDAIRVPKAIEEKNAGNPMHAADVAKAVGFRQSNDWRFLDLLRSANQYGLVSGTGAAASISLTKLGQDVVAPSSPSQRSEALLAAFRSVKDFGAVEEFYGGKRIPEDEFFLNTLTREFNIPRDRVDTFAKVFFGEPTLSAGVHPVAYPGRSSRHSYRCTAWGHAT